MPTNIKECIFQACYQHITPHLKPSNAASSLQECLPLMEPHFFASFASQACHDLAALITKAARQQYRHFTRGLNPVPDALRGGLTVEESEEAVLRERWAFFLVDFNSALEQHRAAFQRFQQMARAAPANAWNNGVAIGQWAGDLFSGVTSMLVATVGCLMSGNALNQQMQAEADRLQQGFVVLLEAYDNAMTSMSQDGLRLLHWQRQLLHKHCG